MPILKSMAETMDASSPQYYGLWREFESPAMQQHLRDMGIIFFDLARAPLTADSRNFIDPVHPNERGVLEGLVQLLDDPKFRAVFSRIDADGLREDLKNARNSGAYHDIYHGNF